MDEEMIKRRAFESVFSKFDPSGSGAINTKDFLHIIDELDAMQPEDAEPIMTEEHRLTAKDVVEAGVTMSKKEVLDFLMDLGVEIRDSRQPVYSPELSSMEGFAASPLSRVEPLSASLMPAPDVNLKRLAPRQTGVPESVDGSMFSCDMAEPIDRRSSPLAQSTPNRDATYTRLRNGKENRRPTLDAQKELSETTFSAYGKGRYSPRSPPGSRDADAEPVNSADELAQLHNQIKSLQEREKISERTIASNEEQIHRLEAILAESRAEVAQGTRMTNEMRSACTALEADIHSIEKDNDRAHQEVQMWQQRSAKAKTALDEQIILTDKAKSMSHERSLQMESLRERVRALEAEQKSNLKNREHLTNAIEELERQTRYLTDTEGKLASTVADCAELEEETRRLKLDLDEVKKASLKQARRSMSSQQAANEEGMQHEDHRTSHRRASSRTLVTKETQTDTIAKTLPPPSLQAIMGKQASGRESDQSVAQEEALKQHYATLSNELGLQRSLIDKMIKLKANVKRQKSKSRVPVGSAQSIATAPSVPPVSMYSQLTAWPFLVLYGMIIFMFALIVASLKAATNAPGVGYAELRTWKHANAIEYIVANQGLMTSRPIYAWWENSWSWVAMLGYWLEDRIQDGGWPS